MNQYFARYLLVFTCILSPSLMAQLQEAEPKPVKVNETSWVSWALGADALGFIYLLKGADAPAADVPKLPAPRLPRAIPAKPYPFTFNDEIKRPKQSKDLPEEKCAERCELAVRRPCHYLLNTHNLRYPQMLLHLEEYLAMLRQENIRNEIPEQPQTVLLLGAGLDRVQNAQTISSPQVLELLSFFPAQRYRFIVIDRDEEVLGLLPRVEYDHELSRTMTNNRSNFVRNGLYAGAAATRLNAIVDRVQTRMPAHVESVDADFTEINMQPESIDIMFATYSLMYQLKILPREEAIALLKNYLWALKKGGAAYVDSDVIDAIYLYMGKRVRASSERSFVFDFDDTDAFEAFEIPNYGVGNPRGDFEFVSSNSGRYDMVFHQIYIIRRMA
jgi:hypothetical protein